MPRPRKLDWRGEVELRKAAREGLTARQTQDHLWDLFGEEKIGGEVPELRAIQAAMRKYRTDPSEPWAITQAGADEIRVLLPVARAAILSSDGRKRLTNREADFAVKIHAAVPSLKADKVLEYARSYILCDERSQSADHLDLALILQPLNDRDMSQTYARAMGGDFTSIMVETLPTGVLYSVAQYWPEDVEAGPKMAAVIAEVNEIIFGLQEEAEAPEGSKEKEAAE